MLGPKEAIKTPMRRRRKSRMSKAIEIGMMKIMKILEGEFKNFLGTSKLLRNLNIIMNLKIIMELKIMNLNIIMNFKIIMELKIIMNLRTS